MKHALPLNCSVATSNDELKIHSCLRHTVINFQFCYQKVLIMKERGEFSVNFLWQPERLENSNLIFHNEVRQNMSQVSFSWIIFTMCIMQNEQLRFRVVPTNEWVPSVSLCWLQLSFLCIQMLRQKEKKKKMKSDVGSVVFEGVWKTREEHEIMRESRAWKVTTRLTVKTTGPLYL